MKPVHKPQNSPTSFWILCSISYLKAEPLEEWGSAAPAIGLWIRSVHYDAQIRNPNELLDADILLISGSWRKCRNTPFVLEMWTEPNQPQQSWTYLSINIVYTVDDKSNRSETLVSRLWFRHRTPLCRVLMFPLLVRGFSLQKCNFAMWNPLDGTRVTGLRVASCDLPWQCNCPKCDLSVENPTDPVLRERIQILFRFHKQAGFTHSWCVICVISPSVFSLKTSNQPAEDQMKQER